MKTLFEAVDVGDVAFIKSYKGDINEEQPYQ